MSVEVEAAPAGAVTQTIDFPSEDETVSGLDFERLLNLDDLKNQLDAARQQAQEWVKEREKTVEEHMKTHNSKMAASEAYYVKLVEREKALSVEAEELRQRLDLERAEYEALVEEANQARELGEGLPQQLQILRDQVHSQQLTLETEAGSLQGDEMVKMQKLQALQTAVEVYGERLGLRFEIGDEEDLKFAFKYIDPEDHDREFVIAVRVVNESEYQVVDCQPEMAGLGEMLAECNRTNDLSKFVRSVRAGFKTLVGRGK